MFGRNLATTSSSLPWLLRRSFLIKRLDPRFSNSAGGQDRGIESVSLSSTVIVVVREFEPDDAQKISEGRVSCQFNLLSLRFFAFSTCAGSIVQRTLWAFWPAMAAMGRENNCYRQAQGKLSGKHPPCSSWIWIVTDRLQHVTVTLFESTMSRCPRARRFLFSQDFSSHFKSFLQCPLQVNLRVVWPTGMCQDEWSHANEQVRQDITITAWQRWLMQLGLIWLCLTCSINCTVIWKWQSNIINEASRDITIESYKWYRLHLLTFECIRLIFTHAASRLKRANKKAIPFLSRRLAMHRDEFLRCVAQEINDSVSKGLPTRLLVLLPRNLGHTWAYSFQRSKNSQKINWKMNLRRFQQESACKNHVKLLHFEQSHHVISKHWNTQRFFCWTLFISCPLLMSGEHLSNIYE